jgi:hypothetical protein
VTDQRPPEVGPTLDVAELPPSYTSERAAMARAIGESKPDGMEDVAFVRYSGRRGGARIHACLTPREWDMISSFPDTLAHLTGRLAKGLGLDDPAGAEWELTYVQEAFAAHLTVPSFTCPGCGKICRHPDDLANSYCGNCHVFHPAPTEPPEQEATNG